MKFGAIGAGAVALAFGREALARGHEVVLSSRRGPDALVDKVAELGRGASATSVARDHPEPTAFMTPLIESFGFTAIDLGGLATGGRLQQAGGPLAGRDLVEFGHH